MFSLQAYARKWDRDADDNFAAACYEQKSIEELEDAARADADTTDIATWQLDGSQEWHDAISAALWERMQPRVDAVNALIAALGQRASLQAQYVIGVGINLYTQHAEGAETYTTFPHDVEDATLRHYLCEPHP